MLNRVALDRGQNFADVVLDFVPDLDNNWPDLIDISAKASSGSNFSNFFATTGTP